MLFSKASLGQGLLSPLSLRSLLTVSESVRPSLVVKGSSQLCSSTSISASPLSLCPDLSGVQDRTARLVGGRSETTPHLSSPSFPAASSTMEIGLGWPCLAPFLPSLCCQSFGARLTPSPGVCVQLSSRSCDHPARLEEAVEKLRGLSAVSA